MALALASCCLLALRAAAGRNPFRPAFALATALMLLATAFWLSPRAWTRPVEQRVASMAALDTDKPFRTRLALVRKGVQLFRAQPIFGAGLGRFDLERVELATSDTPWTNRTVLNQRSSHNAYLSLLAETGLTGALSFAVLLGALLMQGAVAAYRLTRRGEAWAGGVWASTIAISLHLWTLSGLTGTLPWFVFGLMAGTIERARQERLA
ncbi:MAG: O-antigen ligase family protein [Bryobacterales bacterium]